MKYKTTPWKHFSDQLRLYVAEWLIGKAAMVLKREPAKMDWKSKVE